MLPNSSVPALNIYTCEPTTSCSSFYVVASSGGLYPSQTRMNASFCGRWLVHLLSCHPNFEYISDMCARTLPSGEDKCAEVVTAVSLTKRSKGVDSPESALSIIMGNAIDYALSSWWSCRGSCLHTKRLLSLLC